MPKTDWACVLQGVTVEVGPHEIGCSGLVEVCWVSEVGGLLECLVWDWAGPSEDQGHCHVHQQGLLGV